jgi:hypothetical protein
MSVLKIIHSIARFEIRAFAGIEKKNTALGVKNGQYFAFPLFF